jgi:archaellin
MDATISYLSSAGITISESEIKKTSSGIEIGTLEANWTVNVAGGQKVNLHQEQIFFKSGEGAVIITYSTVQDATVDLTADIDKIIESIRLLD